MSSKYEQVPCSKCGEPVDVHPVAFLVCDSCGAATPSPVKPLPRLLPELAPLPVPIAVQVTA